MTGKLKNVIIVGAALIVTVVAILAINANKQKNNAAGAPGGRAGAGRGNVVTTVRSQKVELTTLNDYVATNGEVESQNAVEVFPNMAGKISKVYVILGEKVKKGQTLLKIDPSEPGSYYALSPVEAPITGSIMSTPLKAGTKVTTGTAVTMVGDVENLQITVPVQERYVADLKLGLKAQITLEAYNNVVFSAKVVRISPVVDAATRTKEVILHFESHDDRVNAGMFAKVKLFTNEYKDCIAILKDAIIDNGSEVYVFLSNGGVAQKCTVTTGVTVDTLTQITSGLKAGDAVIVEGMLSLADGSAIKDIGVN